MTIQNNLTATLKYENDALANMLAQVLPDEALIVLQGKRLVNIIDAGSVLDQPDSSFSVQKIEPQKLTVRVEAQKGSVQKQSNVNDALLAFTELEQTVSNKITAITRKINQLKPTTSLLQIEQLKTELLRAEFKLEAVKNEFTERSAEVWDLQNEIKLHKPAPISVKPSTDNFNAAILQGEMPTVASALLEHKGSEINPFMVGDTFILQEAYTLYEIEFNIKRAITGEDAKKQIKQCKKMDSFADEYNPDLNDLYVLHLTLTGDDVRDYLAYVDLFGWTESGDYREHDAYIIATEYRNDSVQVVIGSVYVKGVKPLLRISDSDDSYYRIAILG
ncbi:hypothetical protein EQG49_11865 [Periweissella cryptocerci]|uniref:Uncharacterized protein n=1 Tax=Periweissella cryptocerci TaxID=2506420 RepID=A0A4P6YWB3_9LACO|nr:hypothetical protein [Periweissella cryptocerci]QBO37100.1 hypothetical protein EQG49_11865 [Periweissella cryptocerci]